MGGQLEKGTVGVVAAETHHQRHARPAWTVPLAGWWAWGLLLFLTTWVVIFVLVIVVVTLVDLFKVTFASC